MKRSPDVLIVGAGAAGIAAARELTAHGLSVVILEARGRIGGRVLSHPVGTESAVELGAEFVHGRTNESWPLIRQARLTVVDVPDRHLLMDGRTLRNSGDMWEELQKIFDKLQKADGVLTFEQFLKKHCAGAKLAKARRAAIAYVEGFHAARIDRIGVASLLKAEEASENSEGSRLFRVLNGYSHLIERMYSGLPPKRVALKLNTVVQRIAWGRGRVEIRARTPGAQALRTFRARRALITLPLGVLQADTVRFEPEIPEHRAAIGKLAMGSVVRIVLRFKSAFWEDPKLAKRHDVDLTELNFIHAPADPFLAWWTALPVRTPTLTAWTAGPRGEELSKKATSEVVALALSSVARIFRMRLSHVRAQLETWHYHNWSADPYARGAYSYVPADALDAPRQLGHPVENTLFFAGEATDTSGDSGTVHGAIRSGQRAAKEILRGLKG